MRATPVIVISPLYPPLRGGLADHTEHLARLLAEGRKVELVTSSEGASSGTGDHAARIGAVVDDWKSTAVLEAAITKCDPEAAIVWQYVPHMYGRGGVNHALPQAMANLRRSGRRQFLIAHEIAAPYFWLPNRWWYAWSHRRQWRNIIPSMEGIAISTEAWLVDWRQRIPELGPKAWLSPSPSHISESPISEDARRAWRASQGWAGSDMKVMASFGSLGTSRLFDWVEGAWRHACEKEGIRACLAVVGAQTDYRPPQPLANQFRSLGYLPEEQVSGLLQCADLLLFPFIDGVSERRTSVMAGLAHGRPVLTTIGHNTGPRLRGSDGFKAVAATQPEAFAVAASELLKDPTGANALGRRARVLYDEQFDWRIVIHRLTERLDCLKDNSSPRL